MPLWAPAARRSTPSVVAFVPAGPEVVASAFLFPSMRIFLADESARGGGVGGLVVGIDTGAPGGIAPVGPIVLVEARCGLEAFHVHVEREALVLSVDLQSAPGNREQA